MRYLLLTRYGTYGFLSAMMAMQMASGSLSIEKTRSTSRKEVKQRDLRVARSDANKTQHRRKVV